MPVRPWVVVGFLVLAGAAPPAPPGSTAVLELHNETAGRSFRVALPDGRFAVTYHHSMYDQPVTEEFTVGPGDALRLRAVSSPSAAVLEYFGITAPGERHPVDRTFRELVFRVAAGPEQHLRAAGSSRSFLEFGAHGDRLVVRAARAPALTSSLDPLTSHR